MRCCIVSNLSKDVKQILEKNIKMPIIYGTRPLTNNCISLEHIFPKCFLEKKHHNDIHNIFLSDKYINNKRSNFKFIELYDIKNDKNWLKINNNNYVNTKKRLFIPEEESKGIIARSIMYMCYEYGYDYSKIISEENLINWCLKYEPTEYEKNHNQFAYTCQFNLNKFISKYGKKNYYKLINKIIK
jgi:endonuclease I